MQPRGIIPVAWLIVGLTTIAIGLLTALTQTKWVGPLLVGVGTCAFAGFMIWRWRTHRLVDGAIGDDRWLFIAPYVPAVIGGAFATFVFWLYLMTPGLSPCWCADVHRFHTWFELVAGGFGVLWIDIRLI